MRDLSDPERLARHRTENKADNTRELTWLESLGGIGLFEVSFPAGTLTASPALSTLLGGPPDPSCVPLEACPWIPASDQAYVAAFWRMATPGQPFEFRHRVVHGDGRTMVVRHRGILERFDGGDLHGVGLLQDITVHVEAERRIKELTDRDEVTGLPNRASLREEVELEAAALRNRGGAPASGTIPLALIAIHVPTIEELGTAAESGASNSLAMTIASRLGAQCGPGDLLARIGEAGFAVLPDSGQHQTSETLVARARRLRAAVNRPARIGASERFPQCAIGIAGFPGDADDPANLIDRAQSAASGASPGAIAFAGEADPDVIRSLRIESALPGAITAGELSLAYQPVMNLTNGEIASVEALLRWRSPALGEIPPAEFIPLSERGDMILAVSGWVLREACRQALAWRAAGLHAPRITINLSPGHLQQPNFSAWVQRVVLDCHCDPSWLGLEVPETALLDDAQQAAAVLRDLKAIGFEIALDDFGTGHASLSRLHRLPVDVVKVDRSLIPDVLVSPETASVTRAIIAMSHSLQLRVLAEGVETEDQLQTLSTNGCDLVQGHYFSKAVGADEIAAMLREDRRLPAQFLRGAGAQRTLLRVDDEDNILSSLRRLLRREGYRILLAHSAAEGLKLLAETHVDVILSDQRMPGMTGVEFLRRAKELVPDTVRMVLSGFTDLQSVIDAVNEGAIYQFLTKPWDDEKLRNRIADAFRKKEMADENRRLAREVEAAKADLEQMNARLQEAVSRHSDHAHVLARAANGVRRILDSLPAVLIGVDAEDLIVFVQGDPAQFDSAIPAVIGGPAAMLPGPLTEVLRKPDSTATRLEIGGRRYLAFRRTLPAADNALEHLLILFPSEPFAAPLAAGADS